MLRIIIIDDEFYFRQALKVSLDWERLGFEICGEAENGEEALEKLDALQPDIAIVDINMPLMNGLDFIKKVIDNGFNIKIIILTGYDEFSFAKKAVELGAEKYILKPVDENELQETLLFLEKKILQETELKLERKLLEEQVRTNLPILKDKLLSDLVQGNSLVHYQDIKERAAYLQLDIMAHMYQVIVIEIVDIGVGIWNGDTHLQQFAVANIAHEIMGNSFKCNMCFDNNRVCLIISHSDGMKPDDINIQIYKACDRIRITIVKYLKLGTTIGVGNIYESINDISTSFKEALVALSSKLILGEDKTFLYSDVNDMKICGNFYPVEQRRQLIFSMRVFDTSEMYNLLSMILNQFKEKKVRPELLQYAVMELITTCIEFLAENKLEFHEVFQRIFNPLEEIKQKKSLEELSSWIKEIFADTVEFVRNKNTGKSSKIIAEVKSYIDKNYNNAGLKIDDIANHIHINYNHLCFTFKRECLITINEYITEIRLKKSKELIEEGYTSIQDIANMVGYEDPKYFSKCFKKVFGILPSKHIEK